MPYKDPNVRRIKARQYTKDFRKRMTSEEREIFMKKDRDKHKKALAEKSNEEKDKFYKRMYILAKKRGRYKNITAEMVQAYHKLRNQVIEFLGGRCASPNCKWINDDGTRGCTSKDCLQIDHVRGGGTKDKSKGATMLRKVLRDTTGSFQLLCANCNWLKRVANEEQRVSKHRPKVAA